MYRIEVTWRSGGHNVINVQDWPEVVHWMHGVYQTAQNEQVASNKTFEKEATNGNAPISNYPFSSLIG